MIKSLAKFIGTFGYVGLLPKCPGTAGSLAALPLVWFCPPGLVYVLVTFGLFGLGVWASDVLSKETGNHDPQSVVIDEVVGVMVTLLFIPLNVFTLFLGFVLFRLFDITKPLFIRRLERYRHGFGVMLDDLLAGVYAHIVLRLILIVMQGV